MKKLNKLVAILVAMAMVLSLSIVSAFAAKQNTTGTAVEKVLTMPKNVAPKGSVTIKADLVSVDGVPVADADTSGDLSEEITLSSGWVLKDDSDPATDKYYYGTDAILGTYSHGGQYIYDVYEDAAALDTAFQNDEVTDDTTHYSMTVNVGSDKKVKSVYVGTGENKKELYDEITEDTATDAETDGTVFKNYVSQDRPGTSYDDSAFKVKKNVVADENGIADFDTPFTIQFTIDLPDTPGATTATYIDENGDEQTVPSGTYTANLKHGQYIYFTSIPVGTVVSTNETDVRANGDNATYTKEGEQAATNITADNKLGGEIKNTHIATSATGILMSNLPYIVLALVAIGGMVAYVVVRRRNADEA